MTEKDGKPVLQPLDAEAVKLAKTLIRTARFGALATLAPETGHPFSSRVATATDMDGAPLILVSQLSTHTKALLADPRCGLLLGEPGKGDPLAHPRISLTCRAVRIDRGSPEQTRIERRYLNRHPKARLYAGFPDFSFFRLEPIGASLNGGFARAFALGREDLLLAEEASRRLAEHEQRALDALNAGHGDDIARRLRRPGGPSSRKWRVIGLDADGLDLACGDETARIHFDSPLADPAELHGSLTGMLDRRLTGNPA